ncbi:MAG: PHP domain-containing protein [Halodesulfurarchaeum sp.]
MVYADLHVHTDNSDGTLSIGSLPAAAREAGVAVVGVTDHDRPHPDLDAPVLERGGITIVHGIELRVSTPIQRLDLLGYALDPTPELRAEVERLGANRRERGRKIEARLEESLGVSLDLEVDEHTGRPHLARAVVDHPDTAYESIEGVFEELLGSGRPCYVPRSVPDFERGVDLLAGAAAVVGLAHPFRYSDPGMALERCRDLDAVERYYPYGASVNADEELLESVIESCDLLRTGGSDAHGSELGSAGLDRSAYDRVADHFA